MPGRRKQELDRRTSPCSLGPSYEAVIPAEMGMQTYHTVVVDVVHNDEELRLKLDLLEERRKRITIHKAKAKLKMTKYFNARVHGVTFRPGDFVNYSNDDCYTIDRRKLGLKWEGPYEVKHPIIGLPHKRVATPVATDLVSLLYMYLRR
ncbi:hypothetical protein Tco_1498594 [Tanacetum coccineum]